MPSVVTRRRRTQNAQNDILHMESGAQSTTTSPQQDLSKTDAFVTKYSGYAGIPILLGVLGLYILYRSMSMSTYQSLQ